MLIALRIFLVIVWACTGFATGLSYNTQLTRLGCPDSERLTGKGFARIVILWPVAIAFYSFAPLQCDPTEED